MTNLNVSFLKYPYSWWVPRVQTFKSNRVSPSTESWSKTQRARDSSPSFSKGGVAVPELLHGFLVYRVDLSFVLRLWSPSSPIFRALACACFLAFSSLSFSGLKTLFPELLAPVGVRTRIRSSMALLQRVEWDFSAMSIGSNILLFLCSINDYLIH